MPELFGTSWKVFPGVGRETCHEMFLQSNLCFKEFKPLFRVYSQLAPLFIEKDRLTITVKLDVGSIGMQDICVREVFRTTETLQSLKIHLNSQVEKNTGDRSFVFLSTLLLSSCLNLENENSYLPLLRSNISILLKGIELNIISKPKIYFMTI